MQFSKKSNLYVSNHFQKQRSRHQVWMASVVKGLFMYALDCSSARAADQTNPNQHNLLVDKDEYLSAAMESIQGPVSQPVTCWAGKNRIGYWTQTQISFVISHRDRGPPVTGVITFHPRHTGLSVVPSFGNCLRMKLKAVRFPSNFDKAVAICIRINCKGLIFHYWDSVVEVLL